MNGDVPVVEDKATARVTLPPRVAPPPGFDDFFKSAYRTLMVTALYADATEQEAEDAVAAAMEEILRRWSQIDNPLAYGRRATVSNFFKERERGLRRIRQRLVERGEAMQESTDSTALMVWENRQWVTQLLESLPRAQREVMTFIVDGFTPAEIAGLLGRTPDAVRQNLHAARARLRLTLLEQDKEGQRPAQLSHSPREDAQYER